MLFICCNIYAQAQVIIEGQAVDSETKLPVPQLMVVNKRTNVGTFADYESSFSVTALKTDTIILSALGYRVKKICVNDSAFQKKYNVTIILDKLFVDLKPVTIYRTRSLNQIQRDLEKVGTKTNTYSVNGLNAFDSPITFLYERFSKFSQSKQKVAMWENEDLKRDLLKDLFRVYIKHDIIDLNDNEFDAFIKYLNFSDQFMRSATQLELVLAIKAKYETFKAHWR